MNVILKQGILGILGILGDMDIGVRSQLITLGPNAGGAGALRRLCGRCVGQGPQRAVQRAGGGLVVKERDSVHSQAAKIIWKELSVERFEHYSRHETSHVAGDPCGSDCCAGRM